MKPTQPLLVTMFFSLVDFGLTAALPATLPADFGEEPFSSNRNPDTALIASTASYVFKSITKGPYCELIGVDTDYCKRLRSLQPSKTNILHAKTSNKTQLQLITKDRSDDVDSILVVKPVDNQSTFFYLSFTNYDQRTVKCSNKLPVLLENGDEKCLVHCIRRFRSSRPQKATLCSARSLPSVHYAVDNTKSNNLIKCVDEIWGAAPC